MIDPTATDAAVAIVIAVPPMNNPNTIPDLTWIRYSRFGLVLMFPLGLHCVLDLATIYVSLGLRDFPVTSLVTL